MSEHFRIAIVGSGPSGLSAAAQAAAAGISHVLLEADSKPASVIRSYQRGKHVMAEPRALPLRSKISFGAGTREGILDQWDSEIVTLGINFRPNAKVTLIAKGDEEGFSITLATGATLTSDVVILAIGIQSNLRKMDVPGAEHPNVQYQLDDPEEYANERIAVIGGGDASIENALALMANNSVIFITRQEGFFNCKAENESQLLAAVTRGEIEIRLDTRVDSVEWPEGGDYPLQIIASVPLGKEKIPCHRIIARLGAEPPRAWLESFGINFPSPDPASAPQLSPHYESSVPGLYIVGALAGYPLIKQAINQGYEVVQYILGEATKPVDEELLEEKFRVCPHVENVQQGLQKVRQNVPLVDALSPLQLRDFLLESQLIALQPGDVVFSRNDYSNSFYCIIEGELDATIKDQSVVFSLHAGQFFGEIGLISGRRRTATVTARTACVLIESPKHTMQRLIDTLESVRRQIDTVSLRRAVHLYIGLSLSEEDLTYLIGDAKIHYYDAGKEFFHEGDAPDGLYLIRRGSVTVSRIIGGKEVILSYISAGNYVGEMALVSGQPRVATVRATVKTEAILLESRRVQEIMERNPAIRQEMDERYLRHVQDEVQDQVLQAGTDAGNLISFLVQQGIGDATDVLLIDESLCIRCDNCEKACAETHDGTSRLDRETGPMFDQIRVPSSCRHCENPLCMKDCPPDAIRREVNGEVIIRDNCIGCGNCVSNCPYDVIQLASIDPNRKPASVWKWLLGLGQEPGTASAGEESAAKLAVKCDMCNGISAGPACVRSCPTGAAIRVGPEEFLDYAVWRNSKVLG